MSRTNPSASFDQPRKPSPTPGMLIFCACVVEILSMLVLSSYPSLIPVLRDAWHLSNADAGIINGLFFAGLFVSVALLTTLTDRFSPKTIYLSCLALGAFAAAGFALFAEGFFSAAALRFAEGVALGGTYMPGLRILTDNVADKYVSRATAFYTSSYYLAAGLSYLLVLTLEPAVGWRWAIVACGMGPLIAFVLACFVVREPPRSSLPPRHLFAIKPIISNRRAVGFTLLYAIHNAELTAFSSWLVPFLVFSQSLHGVSMADADLGLLAALIAIIALPASIGGNEIAHRLSRQVWIIIVAVLSAATAVAFGLSASIAYGGVLSIACIYSAAIAFDSSTITGGMLRSAEPQRKGTTMAFYSLIGFIGAAIGPALFGVVLDLAGGELLQMAWIAAFSMIALLVLIQPLIVWRLIGRPLIYD